MTRPLVTSSIGRARNRSSNGSVFRTWYLSIVEILIARNLSHPEDGFGLQQAVLEEVADGSRDSTTLLWTSSRYVGATYPETRLAGFGEAVRLAEGSGFPVLVRNSGGGAVAANEGSISFSLKL